MSGVVSTTSPISRSRTNSILGRLFVIGDCGELEETAGLATLTTNA
jgi:hypothetical protein